LAPYTEEEVVSYLMSGLTVFGCAWMSSIRVKLVVLAGLASIITLAVLLVADSASAMSCSRMPGGGLVCTAP
jgi:hypothetical protein